MSTNRMATGLSAFICVLAGGFFTAPEAVLAASQKTAKIEKRIDQWQEWENKHESRLKVLRSGKNRWTLYPNYKHLKCWNPKLPLRGPLRLCMKARAEVRGRTRELRKVRAAIARLKSSLLNTGNVSAWNCIHRYEKNPAQGWATNTGNGYYGGLQMDISFQSTYGPRVLGFPDSGTMFRVKGTADRWTPEEQMAVAENARASGRGYYPWPNTARYCGLI